MSLIIKLASLLVVITLSNIAHAQTENTETESVDSESQIEQDISQTPPAPQPIYKKELRKRTHNISVRYAQSRTRTEIADTHTENSKGELAFSYGYEFGYFQPVIGVSSIVNENHKTTDKSSLGGISLGARVNFYENKPGNDLIPFLGIEFTALNGSESSNNNSITLTGVSTSIVFGIDWYPLGEIFAFRAGAYFSTGNANITGGGKSESANLRINGFSFGYVFSF